MTYRYLLSILFFSTLFCSILKSQTIQVATFQLLLLDESNNNPVETTIKWHSIKTNKDFQFKTDKNGKATILVQGNDTYETSIPQSLDAYNVEVPNSPNFKKDLVLKFELEKTLPQIVTEKQQPPNEIKMTYQNLVGLQILNKPKGKRLEIFEIESQKKIRTIEKDSLSFALLTERHYKLMIEGIQIQNDTMNMQSYSPKMVSYILYFNDDNSARLYAIDNTTVLNIVQTNLSGEKVVGDTIRIIGEKSGLQFETVTKANGSALFIVPKYDSYQINLKYFTKIATIDVKSNLKYDFITFTYKIMYPSSAEFDIRKRQEELRIVERDSLYKIFDKKYELSDPELASKLALAKDSVLRKLEQDPRYFEKAKNVVCAVLNRFQKQWVDKVIVTDVTGSMYPYMRQLALWHTLEFMKKERNTYIFFNDGDRKLDFDKVIGRIGGIYITQKNKTDSIIRVMHYAMNRGGGGDIPENNIEALIAGEEFAIPSSEIIMIADSYSPIKDLKLLPKLNKPIHIILCGINQFDTFVPDYLWLAYKTHGSVHTIEEDIMNLAEMVEGKSTTINGRTFKLLNNRFFEVK